MNIVLFIVFKHIISAALLMYPTFDFIYIFMCKTNEKKRIVSVHCSICTKQKNCQFWI